MNKKGVVLLSGGLDSILALRLMMEQDVELISFMLVSPFGDYGKPGEELISKKVSRESGIPIEIEPFGEEYLEIIKKPKFGYGKNMNPCIDCRIFMLKKAKRFMEKAHASFLITGEVVNERPMSQRREVFKLIEKETGLEGLIVRPLSGKLLPPTIPEKEGILDREKFLSISGRGRKIQLELKEKYNLKDYLSPAGGCRLTIPEFSNRLREEMEHKDMDLRDVHLLKYGRHFRLPEGSKLIVGRNKEENEIIYTYAEEDEYLLSPKNVKGPVSLLKERKEEDVFLSAKITFSYSDANTNEEIKIFTKRSIIKIIDVPYIDKSNFKALMV